MQGYLGDSMKTQNYFDTDGFAEVGDVGYYDEEGNIFIQGRVNDLIRFGVRNFSLQWCLFYSATSPLL